MSLSSPTPLIDQSLEQQEACRRLEPRYFDIITREQRAAREEGREVPWNMDVLLQSQALTREQWRATGEEHFAAAEQLLAKEGVRSSYDLAAAQVHATLAVAAATSAASDMR